MSFLVGEFGRARMRVHISRVPVAFFITSIKRFFVHFSFSSCMRYVKNRLQSPPINHPPVGYSRLEDFSHGTFTDSSLTTVSAGVHYTTALNSAAFSDTVLPSGPPPLGKHVTIHRIRVDHELTMNSTYGSLSFPSRFVLYIDENPGLGGDLAPVSLYSPLFSTPRFTIISDETVVFQRPALQTHTSIYSLTHDREIQVDLEGESGPYALSKRVKFLAFGYSASNILIRRNHTLFVTPQKITDAVHPSQLSDTLQLVEIEDL